MAKKKAAAPDIVVKARALTKTHFGGEVYEADSIISAPASDIEALEGLGLVDSDDEAVAYAESIAAPKEGSK